MTAPARAARIPWWRVVQVVLALSVIGLAVRSLAANWNDLRTQPVAWHIGPVWLIASVLIVWAMYAVLVEAWRRVVLGMRQRLGYLDAARICMIANLGKYIPGKVWSIAGAAMLAQRAGVSASAAVAAGALIQALSLSSGVIVVALLAPHSLRSLSPVMTTATVVAGALAALGVVALSSARALAVIQRWLPERIPRLVPIPRAATLVAFTTNAIGWGAYGAAFLCLVRGLTPDVQVTWFQATTVFAASYVVGLVAVFAPAGLGPRESLFVLLLMDPLGPKRAVALALATRVLLTITELGAAVPFLLVRKEASR